MTVPPTPALAASRRTDRLFLAVLPTAAATAAITQLTERLRSELGLTGTPTPPERMHATLHFLGDHPGLPQLLIDAVAAVGTSVAARQEGFDLAFDRVGSFPRERGRRPLVLRGTRESARLAVLQQALCQGLTEAGLPNTGAHRYTPHLTLLYDPIEVAERPLAGPIGWTVTDFVLVRSRIGQRSHEVLARWPLRALA